MKHAMQRVQAFVLVCLLTLLTACGDPSTTTTSVMESVPDNTGILTPNTTAPNTTVPDTTAPEATVPPPVLIAEELDPATVAVETDQKTIPDMGLFFGRRESTEEAEEWTGVAGYEYVVLQGEEELGILLEYFDLLQTEFGFEMVNSYHMDWEQENPFGPYVPDGLWSVAFRTTRMDAGLELKAAGNNAPCDLFVSVYKGTAMLAYSTLFNIVDTGHRHSAYEGDEVNSIYGPHVLDAYQLKQGYYSNVSDGALRVEAAVREETDWYDYVGYAGSAAVIVNGSEARIGTAEIGKRSGSHYYYFKVENIVGGAEGQWISLRLPVDAVVEGAVFRLCDFLSGHQREKEIDCYSLSYAPSYADEAITASYTTSPRGCVEACTVRVLQWDNNGEEDCVIYVSVKMVHDLELLEVECLIAAPVNDEEQLKLNRTQAGESSGRSDDSEETCSACTGSGRCRTCGGSGYRTQWIAQKQERVPCASCAVSGRCSSCGGSGKQD